MPDAPLVRPGAARFALAARQEHLDGDAISFVDTPARRGGSSDAIDDADGFVSGDEGVGRRQNSGVLLVVRPAEAAGFETEERVVVADVRDLELALDQTSRGFEDESGCVH
jgi:hypothetical protein